MFAIRYCGGCNPHYDRVAFANRVKEHFNGRAEFELAQEGKEYEGLLVIGGCSNCCASHKQFTSLNPPKLIWGEEFFDDIVKMVEGIIDESL